MRVDTGTGTDFSTDGIGERAAEAERAGNYGNVRSEDRPFFRSGKVGQWREGGLTLQQIAEIEKANAQAMLILGYNLETVEVISQDEAKARQEAAAAEAAAGEIVIEE